jgi:hypothetical protein
LPIWFYDAAQSANEIRSVFRTYVMKAAHVENKIEFAILKRKLERIAHNPPDFHSCFLGFFPQYSMAL